MPKDYPWRLPFSLIVVMVLCIGGFWALRQRELNQSETSASNLRGSASPNSTASELNTVAVTSDASNADPTAARGAGYIWGAALKDVYAGARITPDGNTRLNVSSLAKAFKGYVSPINLGNATASPRLRGEYLSAAITAALGLDGSLQPEIVAIMEESYRKDGASLGTNGTQEEERAVLSAEARARIAAILPNDSQEAFAALFGGKMFLFETMAVSARSLEYQVGDSIAVADGNATFAIQANGSLSITADATSFSPEAPKK